MHKLKIHDQVIVISGKDKGKIGKIVKIFHKQDKLIVENINIKKKCIKQSKDNPNGGVVDKEFPFLKCKVALVDPKLKCATRVRIENINGFMCRKTVKSGVLLDKNE